MTKDIDPSMRDRRLRRTLESGVIALLVAIVGFGVAALGHIKIGWWIIAIAAVVNLVSVLTFLALKLKLKLKR